MITRGFLTLAAIAAGATALAPSAGAQQTVVTEETVSVTEFTCDNHTRYSSSWRDNWFIQLGAGVNTPIVERGIGINAPGHAIERDRMTVTYNFGVGRWMTPYLGFRLNALGGVLHTDVPTLANPNMGWTSSKHVNLNFELMWDMCNSLGGVNPKRPVSVIPFVGLGGDYNWDMHNAAGEAPVAINAMHKDTHEPKTSTWTLPVSAGIQFRFRLCKYVDFFAEARAGFYGDNWNNTAYGDPVDINLAAVGGFNINFGGRKWNEYNECASASEIAALNNQVNTLRGELLDAAQTIAALQSAPKVEQKVTNSNGTNCPDIPLLSTVRFKINSAVVTSEEEVNVYNMAEWLKANPSEKISIVGYADKDTGTADYNMALSEKRANAVADLLVNKYGISRNRLNVKYDGSNVQPYGTNNWNRIVIFTQK
ncbi:MAG: OmpA family protein [Muribaculaceae bacterium]|nr:OmpA family protein [Muribaculaceae bacterium]